MSGDIWLLSHLSISFQNQLIAPDSSEVQFLLEH
jgi:hypothetical protein